MDNGKAESPDKLIVKGVPPLDGVYPCDLVAMLLESTPHTLTNREGHRVKTMSGIRAGEYWEAMDAGDNDLLIALAAVVMTRAGRTFDEAILWDAPMGSAIDFDIADRGEDEGDPPPLESSDKPPLLEVVGGETSSEETSVILESDLSGIGHLSISPSDPLTLET